jgi:hypothetical protein
MTHAKVPNIKNMYNPYSQMLGMAGNGWQWLAVAGSDKWASLRYCNTDYHCKKLL